MEKNTGKKVITQGKHGILSRLECSHPDLRSLWDTQMLWHVSRESTVQLKRKSHWEEFICCNVTTKVVLWICNLSEQYQVTSEDPPSEKCFYHRFQKINFFNFASTDNATYLANKISCIDCRTRIHIDSNTQFVPIGNNMKTSLSWSSFTI